MYNKQRKKLRPLLLITIYNTSLSNESLNQVYSLFFVVTEYFYLVSHDFSNSLIVLVI